MARTRTRMLSLTVMTEIYFISKIRDNMDQYTKHGISKYRGKKDIISKGVSRPHTNSNITYLRWNFSF